MTARVRRTLVPTRRPPGVARWVALGLAAVLLGACATSPPAAAPGPSPGFGVTRPLACTSVTATRGSFAPPEPGTLVTIAQIAQVVGYPVSDAQPDTPSATSFRGYESCQYGFTTPTLGLTETIHLVVGVNPLDGRSADDEFTATEDTQTPLSARGCTGNGCSYRFASYPSLGDGALRGSNGGNEVLALRRGRVYLEVGPGTLKEPQMANLAQLIISAVQ